MLLLLYNVLDYIYSMNGVTQHAKPVMVGQPAINTPVGKYSVETLLKILPALDFLAASSVCKLCEFIQFSNCCIIVQDCYISVCY